MTSVQAGALLEGIRLGRVEGKAEAYREALLILCQTKDKTEAMAAIEDKIRNVERLPCE